MSGHNQSTELVAVKLVFALEAAIRRHPKEQQDGIRRQLLAILRSNDPDRPAKAVALLYGGCADVSTAH